jgi:cyclase
MAHRMLIIARMNEADTEPVAKIFAESDATDLPLMLGASRRTLFHYRGLYLHLVEAQEDFTGELYEARDHSLFKDVNAKLSKYISPYDPNWKEPRDAMADPFYSWVRPS